MSRYASLLVLVLAACGTAPAPQAPVAPQPAAEPAPAPQPAMADGVDFGNDLTSAPVTSPVHVAMTVHGKTVLAAGELVEGTGHHHIIIDGEPIPQGTIVPADPTHIHFGAGQTETDLELTPGVHTLTLQFANGMHESFGPDWSKTITVTVAE